MVPPPSDHVEVDAWIGSDVLALETVQSAIGDRPPVRASEPAMMQVPFPPLSYRSKKTEDASI
jgi:hypothetical protein